MSGWIFEDLQLSNGEPEPAISVAQMRFTIYIVRPPVLYSESLQHWPCRP